MHTAFLTLPKFSRPIKNLTVHSYLFLFISHSLGYFFPFFLKCIQTLYLSSPMSSWLSNPFKSSLASPSLPATSSGCCHFLSVQLSILLSELYQLISLSSWWMANSCSPTPCIHVGQEGKKVESKKVGLKLNIQKTKIMASSPITSWEIDGETVETVSHFIFLWWLQPWN